MQLVQSRNLGGAMTWSIETDDFRGMCGETYPLLKAMNRGLGVDVGNGGGGSGGGGGGGGTGGGVTAAPTPKPTPEGGGGNGNGGNGNGGSGGGSSEGCTGDGYFWQIGDCNRFYQCVNGARYDFSCGEGLYFNPDTLSCGWPADVNCPY
ncbi:acidic mammalian chitinase-like [Drosophila navojoa]|uniref:acidic mammalian chitinase-like n=1 Tax=Drosophila navojoa TaxID=7232 RepID=UPI0011BE01C7|nr:acidic mammalian chitinase-like [Drosophila navojoa]